MSFALAQYRNARVSTASPVEIVVSLYEGAIRFLREAIAREAERDLAGRGERLGRAHAIVSELLATLDHERAPEMAGHLASLYDFVLHRIQDATVKGAAAEVEPAIVVLDRLRSAWAEIAARGA